VTTTDFTKLLSAPLAEGKHDTWDGEQCVMERVAMLWALANNIDVAEYFSDLPGCTNTVIARAAQMVNDSASDQDRQRLNTFVPRLLRARRTESDRRIGVRLALWAARRVLHLVDEQDRPVCEQAIAAAEAWLADPSEANRLAATVAAAAAATVAAAATPGAATDTATYAAATATATAAAAAATATAAASAHAAYAAATAAYAAAYAAATATNAADAANAAAAATNPDDLVAFLDGLLDAWEEAVTKEGEDLYVPQRWEDDALSFVAEYMAAGENRSLKDRLYRTEK
jgi:hypothetical protein